MHSSRSTEAAASIGQHVEFAIRLAGEGGAEEGKSRFAAGGGCPREFLTWKPGHLLGKGNESGKAERDVWFRERRGLGSRVAAEAVAIASSRGSSYINGRG